MARPGYWERFQRQRISRRRLLAATGAGAAGLTLAAACGGEDKGAAPGETLAPGQTPSGETPRYGGRWQAAASAVFDTLDPHLAIASALTYFPRIYNLLVKQSSQKPDFIFMDLAEEYEAPDPDGTEWIFHIRPGVKIAPNQLGIPERDMDAEDAYVSFERIRTLPEAKANAFAGKQIVSHEAVDPSTYVIRTPKPYAFFLLEIGGWQYVSTIPPRELILENPDRMLTTGVGGGPFFVRPGGYAESDKLILDKNPNYYRTDPDNNNARLPYIDGIDAKVVPDPAAVRTAFLSKQAYSYGAQNRAEVEELLGQYDLWASDPMPVYAFISFTMNVLKEPWDDARIRKAAMYALNRQEYVDRVYQGDAKPNGLVHWPTGDYALPPEELEELQPYDPEKSKELIRAAGYELPLAIKMIYPTGNFQQLDQHLPIWLRQMEEAGFKVEAEPQPLDVWIGNYTEKRYDSSLHVNQTYETPEFPLNFHHSKGPQLNGIYSNGIQDPEVDAALEAYKSITDHDELVKAIHDVQRLIYEKGPSELPLVSPYTRNLYWNFVKNLRTDLGLAGEMLNTRWLTEEAPV